MKEPLMICSRWCARVEALDAWWSPASTRKPQCLDVPAEVVCFFLQAEGGIRDVAVTGVQTCALPISHVDHIVLFSGDGDFRSLVEAVQRRGVRVTVISTVTTQPPMVADELRRQADIFVDIIELQPKIGRDPAERAARETPEPRHTPQVLPRPTPPQPAAAHHA